jgi:hypothetical protein
MMGNTNGCPSARWWPLVGTWRSASVVDLESGTEWPIEIDSRSGSVAIFVDLTGTALAGAGDR